MTPTIESLEVDLTRIVWKLRSALRDGHMVEDELGEAARVLDDLARTIAVVSSCRNAVTYVATHREATHRSMWASEASA